MSTASPTSEDKFPDLRNLLAGRGTTPQFADKVLASIPDGVLAARTALGWHRLVESSAEGKTLEAALTRLRSETNWAEGRRSGVMAGLSILFGASPYFTDLVTARPQRLLDACALGPLHHARSREEMESTLRRVLEQEPGSTLDRRIAIVAEFQASELLRLGWRDYGNLSDPETNARELSDLADSIIRWACREAWMEATARHGRPEGAPNDAIGRGAAEGTESALLVIGMGKLGGRELNFSSDVDLVFLYGAEGTTTGRADGAGAISHHQFFGQMGERIGRLLAHRGPVGQFYRVDLRLRPEGKLGPVARSLPSLEAYFGEQARDWERVSWLKARAITGAGSLLERFERVVTGFVYAPIQPERLFAEVESLKRRIDATLGAAEDGLTMDVKRGRGGIREIEFTATVLQVLYGHHHRALRVRPLLLALARLAQVGLISGNDPVTLALNYGHLRRVEHHVQMEHGRQEHRLPPPGERRDVLAASLGLDDGDHLTRFMAGVTDTVHEWYSRFFDSDRTAITGESADVAIILAPDAPPDVQLEALRRRGFSDPRTAKTIQTLAYGTSEVFVSAAGQRSFEQLVPSLLRLAAGRPRPDQVLVHLHSLMQRLQSGSYYYEVLAGHPGVLRLVAFLFGTSDHLSEIMLAHPEFFDRLIQGDALDAPPGGGAWGPACGRRLKLALEAAKSLPARERILRRAIEFEILLCGLMWLLNLATFEQALEGLAESADMALDCGLEMAAAAVAAEDGMQEPSAAEFGLEVRERLAIVALGKYGSRELNFRGDLDVVLLDLGAPDAWWTERLARVVQRLAAILGGGATGRGWTLDWRLRPWGADGPLVVAASEWMRYAASQMAAWEVLSAMRCRVAVGARPAHAWLEGTLLPAVRKVVVDRMTIPAFLEEVGAMRGRLEEQAAKAGPLELKRSAGGVMDAEFALESYLALQRGGDAAGPAFPGPDFGSCHFKLWDGLARNNVGPAGVAGEIARAHRLLRLCENVARTVAQSSGSVVPDMDGGEFGRAVWRNLAIVGVPRPAVVEEAKRAMRGAYEQWMRWLATL